MKCISTLTIFLLTFVGDLTAQVKDINEAKSILIGGWEREKQNERPNYREQYYYFSGDSCYIRYVDLFFKNSPTKCVPADTVFLDKHSWIILSFDKKKQIAKVAIQHIQSKIKLSCSGESLENSAIVTYVKFLSRDKIVYRGDHKKYNMFYNRKKDQINYSPW